MFHGLFTFYFIGISYIERNVVVSRTNIKLKNERFTLLNIFIFLSKGLIVFLSNSAALSTTFPLTIDNDFRCGPK